MKIPCSCDQAEDLTRAIKHIVEAFDNYQTGVSHGEEGHLQLEETIDEANDLVVLYKAGGVLF
jgi:hypothetical protein